MDIKKMKSPSVENVNKAIKNLEKMGHDYLPLFLKIINDPNFLNEPLGPNKECLSLDEAHKYIRDIENNKINNSIRKHMDSCRFCRDLTKQMPRPEISKKLKRKIQEKILGFPLRGVEVDVVHAKKINQYAHSICLKLPASTKTSEIDRNSLLIDNISKPISISTADCDGDKKKELKVVFNKNRLKKRNIFHKTHTLTCSSRSGKSFFALTKSLD